MPTNYGSNNYNNNKTVATHLLHQLLAARITLLVPDQRKLGGVTRPICINVRKIQNLRPQGNMLNGLRGQKVFVRWVL